MCNMDLDMNDLKEILRDFLNDVFAGRGGTAKVYESTLVPCLNISVMAGTKEYTVSLAEYALDDIPLGVLLGEVYRFLLARMEENV